jgi:hypothetical protein
MWSAKLHSSWFERFQDSSPETVFYLCDRPLLSSLSVQISGKACKSGDLGDFGNVSRAAAFFADFHSQQLCLSLE